MDISPTSVAAVSCQELSPAFSQLGYGIISFLQGLFFELLAQRGALLAAARPSQPRWPRPLTPELSSTVRCGVAEADCLLPPRRAPRSRLWLLPAGQNGA